MFQWNPDFHLKAFYNIDHSSDWDLRFAWNCSKIFTIVFGWSFEPAGSCDLVLVNFYWVIEYLACSGKPSVRWKGLDVIRALIGLTTKKFYSHSLVILLKIVYFLRLLGSV